MPETMTKEAAQKMIEDAIGVKMAEFQASLKANQAAVAQEDADIKADFARWRAVNNPDVKSFRALPRQEKLKAMAHMLAAVAHAPRDPQAAARAAKDMGDNFVAKALNTAVLASGGVLVQPEFAAEFIELLREMSVIGRAGPRRVGMTSMVLQFGGIGTGVVAAYRGEGITAAYSEPTTRGIELHARLLGVQTAATEQFLREDPSNANFVQDELQAGASARTDIAAVRGTGALDTPRGLRWQTAAANVYAETCVAALANGSTLAEVSFDLIRMMASVKTGNLMLINPVWLVNTNAWRRLYGQQDALGRFVWQEEMKRPVTVNGNTFVGTINGIPYIETGVIPVNLATTYGGGALVASELYLADMWHYLMGETKALTIKASSEASYTNALGVMQSAFSNGETVFQVEMEHDFALRHATKCAVLTNNTWT